MRVSGRAALSRAVACPRSLHLTKEPEAVRSAVSQAMAPHWHDTWRFYRNWADTADARRMDTYGSFATLLGILRARVERWKAEDAGTWKPKGEWVPGFGHMGAESVTGYRAAGGFDPCSLPSAALAKAILDEKRRDGLWPPPPEPANAGEGGDTGGGPAAGGGGGAAGGSSRRARRRWLLGEDGGEQGVGMGRS